jgi:flagellar biosynthesis anti-sigma factor FlgM
MVVASVTKGPLLYADDATLKSGMDHRDNPSPVQSGVVDPLRALDDERQAKIAKLKQAVADGTYHVSAEDLADKLIQHMLEPKG